MSEKLKLTKLELETKDGKKVELSIEEAKELHAQLHELFGDKTVYIPGAPVIIDRNRWPYNPYAPVWSNYGSGTSIKLGGTSGMKATYHCESAS